MSLIVSGNEIKPTHQTSNQNKLSYKEFKELARYAEQYLIHYSGRLACEKNISGFVRIKLPAPQNFRHKIDTLRLNFRDTHTGINITPDTIHSHPRYFESIIIHGGYTHALYEQSKAGKIPYDLYRVFKDGASQRNLMFIGSSRLDHIKNLSMEKGNLILFPTALIHKILQTKPLSLTLNAVFRGKKSKKYFDAYKSNTTIFANLDTKREIITGKEANRILSEITKLLHIFNKNL